MVVTSGGWVKRGCISKASGFQTIFHLYSFEEGLWNHLQGQYLGHGAPDP